MLTFLGLSLLQPKPSLELNEEQKETQGINVIVVYSGIRSSLCQSERIYLVVNY